MNFGYQSLPFTAQKDYKFFVVFFFVLTLLPFLVGRECWKNEGPLYFAPDSSKNLYSSSFFLRIAKPNGVCP